MERVRERFPHALVLQFDRTSACRSAPRSYAARVRERDDLDVCCDFLEHVRGGRRRQRAGAGRAGRGGRGLAAGRAVREDEGQADTAGSRAGRRSVA